MNRIIELFKSYQNEQLSLRCKINDEFKRGGRYSYYEYHHLIKRSKDVSYFLNLYQNQIRNLKKSIKDYQRAFSFGLKYGKYKSNDKSKWIKPKDGLPDDYDYIIFMNYDKEMYLGYYIKDRDIWIVEDVFDEYKSNDVVAWIPIPKYDL